MIITRSLLASLNFRVFDKNDYFGFAGVESPVPLIAEDENRNILVIIDGAHAELYQFDIDGSFDLIDSCENINELPTKSAAQIKIEKLKAELAELEQLV